MSISDRQKGLFFMLLGTFCFSCKGILIKFLFPYGADALTVIGWRMTFVLPLYLLVLCLRYSQIKAQNLSPKAFWGICLLGSTGYYFAAFLDFSGLQYVSAGLERMIVFLYPTFVVLINMLRERKWCSKRTGLSLILSYLGVITVYSSDLDSVGPHQSWGSFLVLTSALVFGIYVVYAEVWMKQLKSRDFTTLAMISACLVTMLHAWSIKGSSMIDYPSSFFIIAAALGFFCTFLPSYMISYGIHKVGANQASIFACLGPAFTILVAYATLGESFGLIECAGMSLTLIASLIIGKKPKTPSVENPKAQT